MNVKKVTWYYHFLESVAISVSFSFCQNIDENSRGMVQLSQLEWIIYIEDAMPIQILMPALSPTMKEGNLVRWLKKEGDTVVAGEVMAEIETDKAIMEVEAVDEGILAKILIPGGAENVPVNTPIAILLEEGESLQSLKDGALERTPPPPSTPAPTAPKASPVQAPAPAPVSSCGKVAATPLARRIAQQQDIDLTRVDGSGPRGRILKRDVESATVSTVAPRSVGAFEDKPVSNMRKIIAKRLLESKQQIPHFYVTTDIQLDALLLARKTLNAALVKEKITVNDFVIRASALALQEVREANVEWMGDKMRWHNHADISVAVAVADGLLTPIVRHAETKTLREISQEMKALAERAKTGKLRADEFQGGSFSISNLGMYGVKSFSAIVNPPQGAILAVGAGEERVAMVDGQMKAVTVMSVTLSVDHRAIDGAVAAKWLQAFKNYMENPLLMMA